MSPLTINDVTCLACGCLCDDVALTVADGRIVASDRACPLGRDWFLADHERPDLPPATIDGLPTEPAAALDRAAVLLKAARAPIVLGLTGTTIEAQAAALALADRLGAVVVPSGLAGSAPRLLAMQRLGRVSATLGEVRDRADVVVFWGVDPRATHPRHLERYSVEPAGRFVPEGRAGRTVLVADAEPTATAAIADGFLRVNRHQQQAALSVLRALVRGVEVDPSHVEAATGLRLDELRGWADRLRAARYAAVFFGSGLGSAASVEALLALVRDLNETTRAVALTLGGAGNGAGLDAVLAWQAAAPAGVDFGAGVPEPLPALTTADDLLARGAADAAFIVADDPTAELGPAARAHLESIPRIVIAPDATARAASVALRSATAGINAAGTVARADGVFLPLRPALSINLKRDDELIRQIEARISAIP